MLLVENQTPETVFASRFRVLRNAVGLSQRQVAILMDMPHSAIAKIETGKRPISLSEAVRLAEIVGSPLAVVIGEPEVSDEYVRHAALAHRAIRLIDQIEAAELEVLRLRRALDAVQAEIAELEEQ